MKKSFDLLAIKSDSARSSRKSICKLSIFYNLDIKIKEKTLSDVESKNESKIAIDLNNVTILLQFIFNMLII